MRPTAQRRHHPRSINHVTVAARHWRARPVRAQAPHRPPGHTAPDRPVLHATGPASPSTTNRADRVGVRSLPAFSITQRDVSLRRSRSGVRTGGPWWARCPVDATARPWRQDLASPGAHPMRQPAPGLRVAGHRPPGSARRRTATSATRLPPISRAALRTSRKVSIMRRETKAGREACTAGRRRAAPDARPARTPPAAFPLVSAIPGNGLRSRERGFESCRGHWSET